MIRSRFHIKDNAKRRGDLPPGRSRFILRRGVTLVELLISILILTIVCLSWFEILSIQSAKREALRREGVERLAGMMEAFLASFYISDGISSVFNQIGDFKKGYAVIYNPDALVDGNGYMFRPVKGHEAKRIHPIFSDEEIREGLHDAESLGYRLHIGVLDDVSPNADEDTIVMDYDKAKDGQTNFLMRKGAKILVGDLYERTGNIDEDVSPRRICRLKLFMKN